MDNNRAVGELIAGRRQQLDLTQAQLADAAGVSRPYLSEIEKGKRRRPSAAALLKIARALHWPDLIAAAIGETPTPADGHEQATPLLSRLEERLRPVYQYGACGDPRNPDDAPPAVDLREIPSGRERILGADTFAVIASGTSMLGAGIQPGNHVWVNPGAAYRHGDAVLARIRDASGTYSGAVFKRYLRGVGPEGQDCLASDPGDGSHEPIDCAEFEILGVARWVVEERPIAPMG